MRRHRVGWKLFAVATSVAPALIAAQLAAQDSRTGAESRDGAPCSISITKPLEGEPVGASGTVRGTATIPANSHLWVLAHPTTWNGWWPQGGGENRIRYGKWIVMVQFGIDADRGDFEIAAVVVNDAVNNELRSWVDQTSRTGRYPSISLPTVLPECKIANVTVRKQ